MLAPEVAVDARRLRVLVVAVHRFAHDLRVESGLLRDLFDRVALQNEALLFGVGDASARLVHADRVRTDRVVVEVEGDGVGLIEHVVADVLLRNFFVAEALSFLVENDRAVAEDPAGVLDARGLQVEGEGRLDVGHVRDVRPVGEGHLETVAVAAHGADRACVLHAGHVLFKKRLVARKAARRDHDAVFGFDVLDARLGRELHAADALCLPVVEELFALRAGAKIDAPFLRELCPRIDALLRVDAQVARHRSRLREAFGIENHAVLHRPDVVVGRSFGVGAHDLLVAELSARAHDVFIERFNGILDARLLLQVGFGDGDPAPADQGTAAAEGELFGKKDFLSAFGQADGCREARAAGTQHDDVEALVKFLRFFRRHSRSRACKTRSRQKGSGGLQKGTTIGGHNVLLYRKPLGKRDAFFVGFLPMAFILPSRLHSKPSESFTTYFRNFRK